MADAGQCGKTTANFPGLGLWRMALNAGRIVIAPGNTEMILLAMVTIASPEAEGTS